MKGLTLVLPLLLCAFAPSCNKVEEKTDPETDHTLKVMSFNMRYGEGDEGEHSWDNRKEGAAAMINAQSPDVFGVQEPYYYQIQDMEAACPDYKSVGVGRLDGVHNAEHQSIFYKTSRVEVLDWGTFWLSDTPRIPSLGWDGACTRSTTWALMKDKQADRNFFFVNTHLDHVGAVAREKGLALIIQKIESMNTRGYPYVLTGDFNMEITDPAFDQLKAKMTNARESAAASDDSPTYHGWGTASTTIDFIWYNGYSECLEFSTVKDGYCGTQYISDHYPVYAIIKY